MLGDTEWLDGIDGINDPKVLSFGMPNNKVNNCSDGHVYVHKLKPFSDEKITGYTLTQ